jgi:hypothetical protein
MVKEAGAVSTDPMSPEDVDHLCAKTSQYASNWAPVADELWKENRAAKAARDQKAAEGTN